MQSLRNWTKLMLTAISLLMAVVGTAQCSICTRTAQQMGEKPAKALNSGIVYLAITPIAILGIIGFRWYKSNKDFF